MERPLNWFGYFRSIKISLLILFSMNPGITESSFRKAYSKYLTGTRTRIQKTDYASTVDQMAKSISNIRKIFPVRVKERKDA
mmetsp:Transcript_21761/g.53286  ORF Transcript_21761/g.53286 Transcript_21761/m.53286 type:complete len:82 (+) Transcript_21761:691-936(+)